MYHRIGYHRPENLWKDFFIEIKTEGTDSRGRSKESYSVYPPIYVRATLCGASPDQQLKYQQMGHPISHVIGHVGQPIAKAGDRLTMDNRVFYVKGVDNPGEQGIWSIYYCEERSDAHDGNQLE